MTWRTTVWRLRWTWLMSKKGVVVQGRTAASFGATRSAGFAEERRLAAREPRSSCKSIAGVVSASVHVFRMNSRTVTVATPSFTQSDGHLPRRLRVD